MATKKCLIIDDVEVSRYVLGDAIQEMGFDANEAAELTEALDHLKRDKFDVIFLDWHLRKKNALDFIPDIRKLPNGAHAPIVICTGVELDKSLSDVQGMGIAGFLRKPITPDALSTELKRLNLI